MRFDLKQIHVVKQHPNNAGRSDAAAGDEVEIECVGGYIKEVDPVTMETRDTHQRFNLGVSGSLTPMAVWKNQENGE